MKNNIIEEINKEFAAVSKEQWLNKVVKDLKGKPYSQLAWQLNDGVTVEPIYTKDDIAGFDTSVDRKSVV